MAKATEILERPTTLAGLKALLTELVEQSERIMQASGSSGNEARCAEWIYRYREARDWAEIVVKKVAPEQASLINWSADPPFKDLWTYLVALSGQARALLAKVSVWADAERLFPGEGPEFVLIDANTPFSASLRLSNLLETATTEVWISDPYLKQDALEHVLGIDSKVSLRLLGLDSPPTSALWRKFRSERGGTSEYRVAAGKITMPHDRFIAVDSRTFLCGASIRQLGERFSALIELTDPVHVKHVTATFEAAWAKALPLP